MALEIIKEQLCAYSISWRSTHQLIVAKDTDHDFSNPIGWGSGFYLRVNEKCVFVTADHVVHMEDHEVGERTGVENCIAIMTQYKCDELQTPILPIGELNTFESFDITDEITDEAGNLVYIPELIDVAFKIFENDIIPIRMSPLSIDGVEFVKDGDYDIVISESACRDITSNDYCLITGRVHTKISGLMIKSDLTIYQDIKYLRTDSDGNFILSYTGPVVHDDWAGLSGAPVITDSQFCIGMIIEINENDNTLKVMPITYILRLIRAAMKV